MDANARARLKTAISGSGRTAKSICEEFGWPDSYVSRIVSGEINRPDPTRLYQICTAIGEDIGFILSGERMAEGRNELLAKIANAPEPIIEQIAEFVKTQGLGSDKK